MRWFFRLVFWFVVFCLVIFLVVILVPVKRSDPITVLPQDYKSPEGRGLYLALMADCAACHTAPGGKIYAGGQVVQSPFGPIYASNITPGKNGIAGWSLDDFRAVLRDGLRPDGTQLYPAMPYESYRKISDEDIFALYDYFMNSVKPVDEKVKQTNLIFPFNQRWGIRIWNWFAIPGKPGFRPRYGDALLDRGAYLVESLAHCGDCHTPRDILFRQSGLDASHPEFLTGQTLDDWSSPDLRGPDSSLARWSSEDIKLYLMSGRNRYSAAVGPMKLVIKDSLQYATPADIEAIVAYLEKIRMPGKPAQPVRDPDITTALLTGADPGMPPGARLYLDNCNACHRVDGKGAAEVFPELDGARLVNASDSSGLIRVILEGSRLPSTRIRPADLAMPGFAWRLNDEEAAELVNFLRTGWTNKAAPVTAADIAKVRAEPSAD